MVNGFGFHFSMIFVLDGMVLRGTIPSRTRAFWFHSKKTRRIICKIND